MVRVDLIRLDGRLHAIRVPIELLFISFRIERAHRCVHQKDVTIPLAQNQEELEKGVRLR